MKYIPEEYHKHLKTFKYQGGSISIAYQHMWSPIAQYLVQFFPPWVAPNLITFSAFLMNVIAHIIFILPDQANIPKWKFFMAAITLFIYTNLDNIDGKQARKTNSSSPLGMLFDHGSDIFNGFMFVLQFVKIFRVTEALGIAVIFLLMMTLYFTAMWVQYSSGHFLLGTINPVDEGTIVYIIAYLCLAFVDPRIFEDYHIFGRISVQLFTIIIPLFFCQLFFMTKNIFRDAIRPKQQIISVLLLEFSTAIALVGLYLFDNEFYNKAFYPFYYTMMFFWGQSVIRLQLCHITKQKYQVFKRGVMIFLFSIIVYVMLGKFLPFSVQKYFIIACIIQGLSFLEFATSVLQEGAQILDINIFSLKEKEKDE